MADLIVTVHSDLPRLIGALSNVRRQFNFAAAGALNSVGFEARTSLGGATKQYFDRPTSFTQRGFLVERATRDNLVVAVYAEKKRDRYLRTQIAGGARGQKPYEKRFGTSQQLVPAAIKLNAFGNPARGTLARVGAGVGGLGNGSVFVGIPKGGNRPFGVWQRKGRGGRDQLAPLFIAVKPSYQQRFPMLEVVTKVVDRRFNILFSKSLERAFGSP
jgi:hypothetical protein